MGIKGLTKLLGDHAPGSIKDVELKSLFGRKIAIDASMSIYQFLVAVRQAGGESLTNDAGDVTSHLSGLFHRTVRLMEMGIKPVYVFDGAPPEMKSGELKKRSEAKAAAQAAAAKAQEEGNAELAEKYTRRVNSVTPAMTADCKVLLRAMGVPVVEAPCEAEAQCAAMAKAGLVYAMASEDMDSLTFGAPLLIRQMWAGARTGADKKGVKPMTFNLEAALSGLDMTMAQFVDVCILCGCDYTDSIKGIGPTKALSLVRKFGELSAVINALKVEGKYSIPDSFPVEEVRELFVSPKVTDPASLNLKWGQVDEAGLKALLVEQSQFKEETVQSGIARIRKSMKNSTQGRLDSFFKPVPGAATSAGGTKRRAGPAGKATLAAGKGQVVATKKAKK
ncbi:hypothetical protein MMPV_003953 [Pyropia vietnamensis]